MEDTTSLVSMVSGGIAISVASEMSGWLAIVCSAVSLISIIIGIIIRIRNSVKEAKDPESDGGTTITQKELEEITKQISESAKQVQERVTRLQNEVKPKDGK